MNPLAAHRLATLGCVLVGMVASWQLSAALAPQRGVIAVPAPPAKLMVRFEQAPSQAAAAPAETAAAQTDAVLPLNTAVAPPEKKPVRPPPSPAEPTAAVATSPAAVELLELTQPSVTAAAPVRARPQLPLIGAEAPSAPQALGTLSEAPPVPSEVPEFQSVLAEFETPGGPVLVLAALVNDQGVVVDTRIVVPSNAPLKDITLTLSMTNTQWTTIDPPMLPGEYRWFELRIDHLLEFRRQSNLP